MPLSLLAGPDFSNWEKALHMLAEKRDVLNLPSYQRMLSYRHCLHIFFYFQQHPF